MNFTVDVALIRHRRARTTSTTRDVQQHDCHSMRRRLLRERIDDLRCQSCHSYASLADPHPPHVSFVSNDCSVCHSETVSGPYTMINPSLHADQIAQVAMSGPAGAGATYDDLTKSCSNTYCHVSGTPTWSVGVSSTATVAMRSRAVGCASGALPTITANCETCHSMTATDSWIKDPLFAYELHGRCRMIDGIDGTYDSATGTCADTYCHRWTPTPAWKRHTDLRANRAIRRDLRSRTRCTSISYRTTARMS